MLQSSPTSSNLATTSVTQLVVQVASRVDHLPRRIAWLNRTWGAAVAPVSKTIQERRCFPQGPTPLTWEIRDAEGADVVADARRTLLDDL